MFFVFLTIYSNNNVADLTRQKQKCSAHQLQRQFTATTSITSSNDEGVSQTPFDPFSYKKTSRSHFIFLAGVSVRQKKKEKKACKTRPLFRQRWRWLPVSTE